MKILKSQKGEFSIEATAILLVSLFVIATAFHVFPAFVAKQNLNTYASELCRTAEISGRIGEETSQRKGELTDNTGLDPKIEWSKSGKIQLGDPVTVTCTVTQDIGSWAGLPAIPVTLKSSASGKSEVYWK